MIHANTPVQGAKALVRFPLQCLIDNLGNQEGDVLSVMLQHWLSQGSLYTSVDGDAGDSDASGDGDHDVDDAGSGSSDGERDSKRGGKRGRGKGHRGKIPSGSGGPYRGLMKLEPKSLELSGRLKPILTDVGEDPIRFLSQGTLSLDLTRGGLSSGDAFHMLMQFTGKLESRGAHTHVQWLFSNMAFFDIAKCFRPNGDGRIGTKMQLEIRRIMGSKIPPGTPLKVLSKRSRAGKTIDMFCQEFGIGCLFLLGPFLLKKG